MPFGVWHPIEDAATAAPPSAGVLQTRAEGILDYATGRSAMVLYACTAPGETLRSFLAGRGARDLRRAKAAGARWIRFSEVDPQVDPKKQMDDLLRGFAERFGAPPIANAGGARSARVTRPDGQD